MQFLWRYIDDLVGKGLDFITIAELMFYTSASLVPMALPLSILMSSLMTFGNLGENYELTALKAAGISLQRILFPLIVLNVFIALATFFFANNVLPIANLKMRSLLYDIRQQRPELQIREGEFYNGIDNYSLRIGEKDAEKNMLYDILIYDHSDRSGNRVVTHADSGSMQMTENSQHLVITLYAGETYSEDKEIKKPRRKRTFPHQYREFAEQKLVIPLTGFGLKRTDESLFKSNYQMMNLEQLEYYIDSLQRELELKQNELNNNLIKRNYTHSIYNRHARSELKDDEHSDTLIQTQVNSREVFGLLTHAEKKRILRSSVSMARNGSNYISSTRDTMKSKQRRLNKYALEWHRKFTIAFACFIFLFIGAPLGAIIRKGGIGMPVVISTLLFIFYYIITLTGEKLVAEDKVASIPGIWFASIILTFVGIFLTYKATTDSVILNMDTYSNFFKKIGVRLKLVKASD
jgi:lipopolysaccharide export system permease protein